MPKNKHILLLSPQPFFQARGTPINVREMLYALSESGYNISLLCYPFGEDIPLPNVTIIRSPKPFFINNIKIGPSIGKIILDVFFLFKALSLSFKNNYSLYHGIEEAGLMAGILGIVTRKPYIVDVDSAMAQQLEESGFITSKSILRCFEILESLFFKRAAKVITVCKALSDEVLRLCPTAKISQIEDFPLDYPSDEKQEYILREKFNIPENKKIVLYGGNFEPYQGVDLLINSVALLKDDLDFNIHLVLVGGSKAHIAHYKDLSYSKGIKDNITFTGQVDSSLMGQIHAQADVLVSPRLIGTNTPLKIYSYMQSEKPIVATNIYSHTQVLDDSAAFLAAPEEKDFSLALKKAASISEVDTKVAKKKAERSKFLAETKYSRLHFREAICKTYKEVFNL